MGVGQDAPMSSKHSEDPFRQIARRGVPFGPSQAKQLFSNMGAEDQRRVLLDPEHGVAVDPDGLHLNRCSRVQEHNPTFQTPKTHRKTTGEARLNSRVPLKRVN